MFERIARCSQGHLFQTTWVPLASFKAIRLGPWRFQRCPVGNHLTLAKLVDKSTLTPYELEQARLYHDVRIP
jgi:hypothetical protein